MSEGVLLTVHRGWHHSCPVCVVTLSVICTCDGLQFLFDQLCGLVQRVPLAPGYTKASWISLNITTAFQHNTHFRPHVHTLSIYITLPPTRFDCEWAVCLQGDTVQGTAPYVWGHFHYKVQIVSRSMYRVLQYSTQTGRFNTDHIYYYYAVVCLTTGPKPPPNLFLHTVRSKASSFKWEYPLL